MAFNVRIFAYTGIATVALPQVKQFSSDAVFVLKDPYIDPPQKLVSNGAAEVVFAALPPKTRVVRIEVDDGNTIRYEVRGGGNTRVAGTNSPALAGRDLIYAGDGDVIAFVDAAAV